MSWRTIYTRTSYGEDRRTQETVSASVDTAGRMMINGLSVTPESFPGATLAPVVLTADEFATIVEAYKRATKT